VTIKPAKKGLMASVLSRMSAGETLISDRHAESMLFGLLSEAEQVTDPTAAWGEVRSELCASWGIEDEGPDETRKPFIYRDGVAVIPVHGILVNRFNWCWGFVTGYDFIRKQKNLALADPDVKLIVYDHDSPGGEAAGCDELAQEIFAERSQKPSLALVNTLSASGAIWLATPCTRVVCAPSGSVGSIGVYIQHMNIGKMLAEWGVEVEFIKNGKYKTSGNQFEKMSDEDRAYLQAMVDERAVEFHHAVAVFRGIEESVVKGTNARVMRPTEAIALGIIDAAEAPATAVASFVAEFGNNEPPTIDDDTDTQEDSMATELNTEEKTAARKAERERIKGITGHENAKGREDLAAYLAHDTDNTVEAAAAILAASPKAAAEEPAKQDDKKDDKSDDDKKDDKSDDKKDDKSDDDKKDDDKTEEQSKGKSKFEQAMDTMNQPNVGGDIDNGGGDETKAKVAEILGAQSAMFGRTHKA
jgi:signal peptide peptidase SppA